MQDAKSARWGFAALAVLVLAALWWSLKALPARLEITTSDAKPAGPELRLPFVLHNRGRLPADRLTYRCRFRQVYDLTTGLRVPRVPTRNETIGYVPGGGTDEIHCDLLFDAPRPVALDLEIIVSTRTWRGKLEWMRQRFCSMPGPQGVPLWQSSDGPCRLHVDSQVSRVD